MTSCESCAQTVRSNALQEVIGHGHPELKITFPQLKTQLRTCEVVDYIIIL